MKKIFSFLFVLHALTSFSQEVDADAVQRPISDDIYYIVPGKCTECKGFHEEPQCAAVCPVDCCVPDDNHVESEETLLNRQAFLHNE